MAVGTSRQAAEAIVVDRCHCERYYCTAILTPTTVDRAFPVVLRQPPAADQVKVFQELIALVQKLDDKELLARVFRDLRYGCLYTGSFTVGNIPTGPWKHYLFVQTVNFAEETLKPEQAAQIIGGLHVAQNTKPQLDFACGPIVFEDGQFDIELI